MTFRERFDAARRQRLGKDAAGDVSDKRAAQDIAQALLAAAVAGVTARTARLPLTDERARLASAGCAL